MKQGRGVSSGPPAWGRHEAEGDREVGRQIELPRLLATDLANKACFGGAHKQLARAADRYAELRRDRLRRRHRPSLQAGSEAGKCARPRDGEDRPGRSEPIALDRVDAVKARRRSLGKRLEQAAQHGLIGRLIEPQPLLAGNEAGEQYRRHAHALEQQRKGKPDIERVDNGSDQTLRFGCSE